MFFLWALFGFFIFLENGKKLQNIFKLKFYWILYYVLIGSQTYKRNF